LLKKRQEKFPDWYRRNSSLPTWTMVRKIKTWPSFASLYSLSLTCVQCHGQIYKTFLLSGKWTMTKLLSCINIEEIAGTSKVSLNVLALPVISMAACNLFNSFSNSPSYLVVHTVVLGKSLDPHLCWHGETGIAVVRFIKFSSWCSSYGKGYNFRVACKAPTTSVGLS